ncbi:hypothetical protein DERP_006719 [Dermatophagoides pteronyssinus]|uniref:Uncharacterized protein n=1 Tax=Dermatophagoides pteronyssinus TaxID=6956 RepID=A0ABQ8IRW9_DERPT|nr:hypothetical protein DERP_006719 [Dermatophagoides pteronyssinus]
MSRKKKLLTEKNPILSILNRFKSNLIESIPWLGIRSVKLSLLLLLLIITIMTITIILNKID